jgi:hypothetical protein
MRKTTTGSDGSNNDSRPLREGEAARQLNEQQASAATPTPKKQHQHQQKLLRQWQKQHQTLRNMRAPHTHALAQGGRPGSSSNWEPARFSFRAAR